MAVSLEVIRTLTVKAKTEGVDAATRELDSYVRAQEEAAKGGTALRAANDEVSKSTLSAAKQFDALARAIDPAAKAQAALARGQSVVARALNEGAVGSDQAAKMLSLLAARHDAMTASVTRSGAAVQQSSGLARYELINLSRQAQDVAVSLAGGQSPFLVLMQQGSQVADIFTSSQHGPAAALRSLGAMIAPVVLSPLTILGTTLAAVGVATHQLSEQQDALARSLNGVGRAAGLSVDGLRAAGLAGAQRSGMAGGTGIELAGTLAGTGRIGSEMIAPIIGSTKQYAHAFNMDIGDAGKELAGAFADPIKGAEQLNEKLGFLDARTKETIRSLQSQGDILGAQRAMWDAYDAAVKRTTDTTGFFAAAIEKAKGAWNDFVGFTGRVASPSIEQKIETLEAQLRAIGPGKTSSNWFGEFLYGDKSGERAEAQRQLAELRRQQAEEQAKATRDRAQQEANRRSLESDALIRQITPELGERQQLTDRKGLLERALGDPETVKKLSLNADEARGALSRVTVQLALFATPVQKIAEESGFAVRQIEARTFAERAAVAMEQSRLQVLRETGDIARAAATAEAARNKLIAEGNAAAADTLRQATDRANLAGMRPYERGLAEIEIRYRDQRRRDVPGAGDLAAQLPGMTAAETAATRLAASFDKLNASVTKSPYGGLAPLDGKGSTPFFAAGGSDLFSAIIRAEGTDKYGDPYNTSLGYLKSRKRLTDMTMDESLEWGDEVRRRMGMNSSAKGAFQIVNTTQRDAMAGLGLRGSDMFSEENQRRMAQWIFEKQGIGAWEGFKRPGAQMPGVANDNVGAIRSTAGPKIDASEQKDVTAYNTEQIQNRIRAVNDDLQHQRDMLRANTQAWGSSTGEMARAAKEQELINQFTQQGIPLTDTLRSQIAGLAQGYGALADAAEEAQRRQKAVVDALDTVRSVSKDALSSFLTDLEHGKSASEALRNSLRRVLETLQTKLVDSFITQLFGQMGNNGGGPGGGLFGGILSGLFGGLFGAHDNGGVIGAPTHFATVPLSAFIGAPQFAAGGVVNGLGSGARPVIAHDGEIIMNVMQQSNTAAAIKAAQRTANGPLLQRAVPPQMTFDQTFQIQGAVSSDDIVRMLQASSAATISEVKRHILSMYEDQSRRDAA